MNDHELDRLFAGAREETAADAGAADRFLIRHRAEGVEAGAGPAPGTPARAHLLRWPLLVACAAVTGVLLTRPAPALPASAAYEAYGAALGEGW